MSIADNIAVVRGQIEAAAKGCGRNPSDIKLVAVSKTKTVSQILEAMETGRLAFGENYAQELRDKAKQLNELQTSNLEWHFIGHLQKNKLKYVLPVASWIHTVDSVDLLEKISSYKFQDTSRNVIPTKVGIQNILKTLDSGLRRNDKGGVSRDVPQINCLIEVNIAGEGSKSGIAPENVFSLVDFFSTHKPRTSNFELRGLMCMPPLSAGPEDSRPYFRKLKSLLDEINSRNVYPEKLTELSMGMSHDFRVAIEEGATIVRLGTAIFGGR